MSPEQTETFNGAWHELILAVRNRKHPFRIGVVANSSILGPEARTVVLRFAHRSKRVLRFHTDIRSQKFESIQNGTRLAWVFQSPQLKLQIRASGPCTIETDTLEVDQAWTETQLLSRRCYLATTAPGSFVEHPTGGFPEYLTDREPTEEESELGRDNFCLVNTYVDTFDVYSLAFTGHTRCTYQFDETWQASWVVP
jgi:hypothetical protein